MRNKKIMIWCGNAPNQKALANKIADKFPVAAIVVENKPGLRKYNLSGLVTKLLDRTIFNLIGKTWRRMMAYYAFKYSSFPKTELLKVESINTDEVYQFTLRHQPDLIIVSGTSLIRKKLLSIQPSIGIINLHTGLSPYVKGGPNCTNWCIANNQPELIGNTIMWINAGIDSGNIITTKQTDITGAKSFFEIHLAVMEDAHQLYIDAIRYLVETEPPYISVNQQDMGKGKLYLTKMWTFRHKMNLIKNLGRLNAQEKPNGVRVIDLPKLSVKTQ